MIVISKIMYIIIFHATIGSPTIRISQLPGSLESVKFKTEIAAMLVFCSLLLVLQQGGMDRALFAAEANREQPFSWQQGPDTAPQFDDPKPPNIILILADDLGWNDITHYGGGIAGGTVPTPNIDSIAQQGMHFPRAYAGNATCAPSRAALLTGRYGPRTGFEFTPTSPAFARRTGGRWIDENAEYPPPSELGLPTSELTIAESLKAKDYHSILLGKWHLGRNTTPTGHGFDLHVPYSVNSNLGRRGFYNPKDIPGLDGGEYVTDRLAELAASYIDVNKDRPFLLYMSHFSVHDPIHGRPDLVEKYKKKLAAMPPQPGPDFILEGNPDSPTYPSRAELDELIKQPRYRDTYTSYANDLVKVKQKQDNVEFAGMVESVDQSLGTLMAKLKEHGLEDDTIVIFMSDNGGMSVMNGTPHFEITRDKIDTRASTSNLPLRGAKGWLYEGGIRVPMIVKWPQQGQEGAVCDEPVISTDFFPTILEMLGVEHETSDIDGQSFTALVQGKEMDRGPIYWHFPHYSNHGMQSPGGAIRDGDYKLLEYFENGSVQLFNLKKDIGEQNDLAKIEVQKAQELTAKLHQWRKEVDAQMMPPNPDYDPATDLWSGRQ